MSCIPASEYPPGITDEILDQWANGYWREGAGLPPELLRYCPTIDDGPVSLACDFIRKWKNELKRRKDYIISDQFQGHEEEWPEDELDLGRVRKLEKAMLGGAV